MGLSSKTGCLFRKDVLSSIGAGEEGTKEGHEIHSARRAARLFYANSPSTSAEMMASVS